MMKSNQKENAVSPVVGVMLMLVVTIVLAALVAAFAGGLGTTTEATPMVTFTVDYSQNDGMLISAAGATGSVPMDDIVVQVSDLANDRFFDLNMSKFTYSSGNAFLPGQYLYISTSDLTDAMKEAEGGGSGTRYGYITAGGIDITGQTFTVKLVKNGKVIGTATGVISP